MSILSIPSKSNKYSYILFHIRLAMVMSVNVTLTHQFVNNIYNQLMEIFQNHQELLKTHPG